MDARIRHSAFNVAPRSTRDTELSGSGVERTKAEGAGSSQSPELAPQLSWDPPGDQPSRLGAPRARLFGVRQEASLRQQLTFLSSVSRGPPPR